MKKLIFKWEILKYKIYRLKLNWENKKLIKDNKFPKADSKGYPFWGVTNTEENHPNPPMKPLGVLFYVDYEYQDKKKYKTENND
ncbi:hypothetical protein OAA15_00365 [bacterium]|nr:hypothetical protein [bacterium]